MGNELIGKQSGVAAQQAMLDEPRRPTVGKQTLTAAYADADTVAPRAVIKPLTADLDGMRTINALAGNNSLLGGDGILVGNDSARFLDALRAIRKTPTEAMVNTQLLVCNGCFQGTTLASQLYYVFINFMKAVSGEEPAALGWFKNTNMTHARGVITTAAYNQAIAWADAAAAAAAARTKTFGGNVTTQPRKVTKAEALKLVDGAMAGDRQITAAADALGLAGFTTEQVENARKMMKRYTALRYTPAGDVDKLHVGLDELERLVAIALRYRTISSARATKVRTFITEFRAQYPRRTDDQRRADAQMVQDGNRDRTEAAVARGQDFLDGLYVLRESIDKRNGFTFNGTVPAQAAMILIRKRLPELERAVASRDAAAIDEVLGRDPVPWCIEKGGPRKVAAMLLETHKNGVWQLELVNDLVGVTPIGPVTKILFSACVEGLKYAANEQSGAETVVNIAFSVAAPYLDNLIGGPAVRNAFLGALRGGLESFAKDFTKIVMMPDKTRSEKITLIENAGKKAILQAFVAAVTGRIKALASNMEEGKKRQLIESILDMAGKFGLDRQLKPELDKFLE